MSTVKRKCQVVMLPTEKASSIIMVNNRLSNSSISLDDKWLAKYISSGMTPQHLYILSDDKINDSDWFITGNDGEKKVYQCGNTLPSSIDRKIIATTDSSLTILHKSEHHSGYCKNLPQPSEGFIQKYIDAYNIGDPIEKVMVDYIEYQNLSFPATKIHDNTITISKVKDSWTREEMIEIAFNAFHQGFRDSENELYCGADIKRSFNKWIKENL